MASFSTKTSYQCTPRIQQFYSGGPFVLSSDASFLACACVDSVKLINPSSAAVKSTIKGDTEPITALALTPDDRVLFSSSHSHQIMAWDLSTLNCIRSWKAHGDLVLTMACHPSGGLLATAGSDRKVCVWDVDGAFCTHFFKGHTAIATCLLFHPDHTRLILFSGSEDSTVRVWDLRSKKCAATLDGHISAVTSLSVSENGSELFSSGRDRVVNIWSLDDYTLRKTIPTFEVLEAVCLLHPKSEMTSRLMALDRRREIRKKNERPEPVFFITAGERGKVRVWDSEKAKCVLEQRDSDVCNTVCEGEGDEAKRGFTSAVLLPDGEGLICATADQQFLTYSIGDLQDGEPGFVMNRRLVGYIGDLADMRFLGEDRLAVATNLEQIYVIDVSSGLCSYVLSGHSDIVHCLDTYLSDSGTWLVVTGSKDNSVRLWDVERRCCLGVGPHQGDVRAVAFSKKSGGFFVSGGVDGMLRVWGSDIVLEKLCSPPSTLKIKAIVAAHGKELNSVAVSPNDRYVCTGSRDRTAHVWRLPDLVSVVMLVGHKRPVWSVAFSPIDQCVLTSSGDKTVKIWAISDGSCLKTFEGHTSTVLRAAFLSRGTQFVSSGADGLLKLWNIKNGECVKTYDEHEDKVWALAVEERSEKLATGSGDGVINLWNDSTEAEKMEAMRREEDEVVRGQELENCILDSDYGTAIRIAVELGRPHRLFEVFSGLCGRREEAGDDPVGAALSGMAKEELCLLFEYIREWNTKPKMCHVAQSLLLRLLTLISPSDLLEMRGVFEVVQGIIPYSLRHFSRVDRMLRSSFLLDFVLHRMFTVEPDSTHGRFDKNHTGASLAVVCHVSEEEQRSENENGHSRVIKKRKSVDVGEKKGKLNKYKKGKLNNRVGVADISAYS